MRRVYFLQPWHGLADEALEDTLYDRQALRGFARIDLRADAVPAAATLLNFRRRLETHDLCKGLFAAINADLTARGLLLREGTLVEATLIAANGADSTKTAEPLHGAEQQAHADAGHTGVEKRAESVALERKIAWQIAGQRGQLKALAEGAEKETIQAVEKAKASGRAFVEHPFHLVKNLFRHRKARCRGLAKNGHQLYALFGLANVVIGRRTAAT